ncbi:MAG: hypothetical protein HYV16_11590 [Gammaproteobacteria bacterium]|nr:hypothetical protein [Gammaproteobacteria bacterium]
MNNAALTWTLTAEAVLVLTVLAGIFYYVLHGSRDLQRRLTMNSQALNRYIKYLLSPEFKEAEAQRLREGIQTEVETVWRTKLVSLEQERGGLKSQVEELEARVNQLQAVQLMAPAPAGNEPALPDEEDDDNLMAATAAAIRGDKALNEGFRDELNRLKNLVAAQEVEIDRLRGQVDHSKLDANTSQLLSVQQSQRDQQQRMLKEMEVCIQVMENELSDTRSKLLLALTRLRNEKMRNQSLRTKATRSA